MFTQGALSHHGGFQRGSVYKSYNDDDDGYENDDYDNDDDNDVEDDDDHDD